MGQESPATPDMPSPSGSECVYQRQSIPPMNPSGVTSVSQHTRALFACGVSIYTLPLRVLLSKNIQRRPNLTHIRDQPIGSIMNLIDIPRIMLTYFSIQFES